MIFIGQPIRIYQWFTGLLLTESECRNKCEIVLLFFFPVCVIRRIGKNIYRTWLIRLWRQEIKLWNWQTVCAEQQSFWLQNNMCFIIDHRFIEIEIREDSFSSLKINKTHQILAYEIYNFTRRNILTRNEWIR